MNTERNPNKRAAQSDTTVELTIKLTTEQVAYWREAISRASDEHQSKKSAKSFFQSLRATETRYIVRELGRGGELKAPQQPDRRSQHSGYNGVI
jgi:hypothetical protein